MKWILCGKNDVAIACLEMMIERGDEVLVVGVAGDDGTASWQGSLRAAAERLGAAFEQPAKINDPAFIDRLREYGARVLLSIQYDQILKDPLFGRIGCPCLNLHYSLLPRHRGVYPVAWVLLEGDDEAGVTLHHMVESIDAGDVIAQKRIPIGPGDTAHDVYQGLAGAAKAMLRESLPFPDDLLATRLPQDASRACYHSYGDLDYSERTIDWKRDAAELHRWIRMMIFPPLNHPETALGGRALVVTGVDAKLEPAAPAEPGTVVASDGSGVVVAAGRGGIRVTGLAGAEHPEANDEALLLSLAVGDRLS